MVRHNPTVDNHNVYNPEQLTINVKDIDIQTIEILINPDFECPDFDSSLAVDGQQLKNIRKWKNKKMKKMKMEKLKN